MHFAMNFGEKHNSSFGTPTLWSFDRPFCQALGTWTIEGPSDHIFNCGIFLKVTSETRSGDTSSPIHRGMSLVAPTVHSPDSLRDKVSEILSPES